ncbi:hypothetical protein D9V37_03290 [Nocardioides mangrovicus]|uniref:Alanine-rich protein n=1 Tax=Nocardioides mangrovicus TaxID=2478913 RepID=A0A3L8P8U2_9ACTN|nr:hypothetical protein D9V37_03290 [Nocardioides mangrovicus]
MRLVGYAYPWDVVEPGFVERARSLGVDEVAVAVSYHSARAATPWSTRRSSVIASHAAVYRAVRETAFGRLTPGRPSWVEADVAETAFTLLNDAGIAASAWLVLLHDSRLGAAHPELAVRNHLGETYPWALCPSHAEVRDYATVLAVEAVRDLPVHRVVLESCGQMGVLHQCTHEKTDAVWTADDVRRLSTCHCEACGAGGLERRQESTDLLRRQLVDALAISRDRLVLHASPDPWETGANPGLTASAAADVGTVVVKAWDPSTGADTVRATQAERVGAYVTAVGPTRLPDPKGYAAALAQAGADELHLYHLGLAGPARWPDLERLSA